MDVENETRPLLTSFENQSWRNKVRKRCMRIPSEVTITGIILGLFLIVVTLLIVLENMETENKDSISLGNNLLASPFKYNKKTEDKTWQDKKDNMKNMKINKELKWDKINKGWKQFPDISGKIENHGIKVLQKKWKEDIEKLEIPEVVDEYGKETDNSLEAYLDMQMSDSSIMQTFNKDTSDIKNLIQSKIKWKQVDDGWKKLSAQGWSDKSIRTALFKAIKERRKLLDAAKVLQSPIKLDQIWDNIIEVWKKNVKEGSENAYYPEMEDKGQQYHKNIDDEFKKEINILQSPKSDMKKFVKDDSGWQKLSEQGWKNKDIGEALVEAWKERENVLQSPMKIQNLWEKATDFFKNLVQKGTDEQKTQKEINDNWAKKFNILQSPMASSKKSKKEDELKKKHSKDVWKDKTENRTDESLQFPINFEDFIEAIIENIKLQNKGMKEPKSQKEINDKFAKEFNLLQSSMPSYKKWKIIDELRKKHSKDKENTTNKPNDENNQPLQSSINFEDFMEQIIEKIKEKKGNKEAEKQKGINDEWKNGMKILRSSKQTDNKWKQVDDHWKTIIEHERNSFFGKNDGDVTSNPKDEALQYSMSLDNIKWGEIDDGWKKLLNEGWKDKDLKEAVYNAWKDGKKLLQSATGYNNMKWKKVNEGWKKISNKS